MDTDVHILLAIDDELERQYCQHILDEAEWNFVIDATNTEIERLEQLLGNRYDCIVLDYRRLQTEHPDRIKTITDTIKLVPCVILYGDHRHLKVSAAEFPPFWEVLFKQDVTPETLVIAILNTIEFFRTIDTGSQGSHISCSQTELITKLKNKAGLGYWEWALASNTMYWCDVTHAVLGAQQEASLRTYYALVSSDDRSFVAETIKKAIREHSVFHLEHTIVLPANIQRIMRLQGICRLDPQTNNYTLTGNLLDITDNYWEMGDRIVDQEEEFYSSIIESLPDSITVISHNGSIKYQSLSALVMFGDAPIAMTGSNFFRYLYPDDILRMRAVIFLCYSEPQSSHSIELNIKYQESSSLVLESICKCIVDPSGKQQVLIVSRDITERKRLESALRASERVIRSFQDNATIGIYRSNTEGRFLYVNQAMARIFEYPNASALMEVNVKDLYYNPEEREKLLILVQTQDQIINRELRLKTGKGNTILVRLNSIVARNKEGGIAWIEGLVTDITQQKRAERALKESEARFSGILDSVKEGIISINTRNEIVIFNNSAGDIFGYSAGEILGKNINVLLPERFREIHDKYIRMFGASNTDRRSMANGRQITGLRKDGTEFPMEATISSLKTENETLFTVVLRDVSEIERTITEKQLFEDIVKNANVGIYVFHLVDTDDISTFSVIAANQSATEYTGVKSEDILGKNLFEAFPGLKETPLPGIYADVIREQQTVELGEISYGDERVRHGIYSVKAFPLPNNCVGITFENITERKMLESTLAQAQKLESIGQLAAGIAHEINTPIQYVSDNLNFLKSSFEDLSRLIEYSRQLNHLLKEGKVGQKEIEKFDELIEEADIDFLAEEIPVAIEQSMEGAVRVSKIVRAMKEFAHPGNKERVLHNINRALESTIAVTQNEWKYKAELVTDFDESLPEVPVIVDEFNQAVLNIIINATHAIIDANGEDQQAKGTITMRTLRRDPYAEIRISDTGVGIPAEIQKKVFDPFFTTKEVGKGTGQGLALAYTSIVDKHGGQLTFESEVGKGTEFIIRLPLVAEPQA